MKRVKQALPLIAFFVIAMIVIVGYTIKDYFENRVDMNEVNEIFESDQHDMYFYNQLDETQQEDYRLMYYAITTFQESIPLNATNIDDVSDILYNVMYDHPELYYIKTSYRYTNIDHKIKFIPDWNYTQEDIQKYNQKIEMIKDFVLKKANQKKNDIDKAKVIYDYIIQSVEYKESQTDQQIISSLIEKKSVCAGYAKAYQYLLNEAGIKSAYITGKSLGKNNAVQDDENHAWVMLKIDNDYYYSDPTWGDVIEKGMKHTCSGYFLMNSEEMLKNYKPEVKYEKTKENKIDYFNNIGCSMTSYNKKTLSHAVKLGLENKTRVAEVKCTNDKVYNRVKKALKSEYLGYYVLMENGCYSEKSTYYCNDRLRVIELYY